jgi:hypothetical protein
VLIAASELHWHGAGADEAFTHLSILTPGQSTIEDDETNVLATTAAGPPLAAPDLRRHHRSAFVLSVHPAFATGNTVPS